MPERFLCGAFMDMFNEKSGLNACVMRKWSQE